MKASNMDVINVTINLLKKGHLNAHKMSVHEGIKYECDQCGHKFTQKGDLKRHKMSVHEGIKKYIEWSSYVFKTIPFRHLWSFYIFDPWF